MESSEDLFQLETIETLHGIATSVFVPFVIERVKNAGTVQESRFTVTLREIPGIGSGERTLRLAWSRTSVPELPLGVQEAPLTEWAAVGLACAVVWAYAGLRIHEVTSRGSRFDYWVRDGDNFVGLEVSGTMAGDVASRHREKVNQLLDNPFKVDGYVVVVDFVGFHVLFSFHRFEELPS